MKTHGMSNTPLHQCWINMRNRCSNPRNVNYPRYGARGIRVCARWDSFVLFAKDIGERPSLEHSLDRINNSGNYEPANCRWATHVEQSTNRRGTVPVGEIPSMQAASRETGISKSTIQRRIAHGHPPLHIGRIGGKLNREKVGAILQMLSEGYGLVGLTSMVARCFDIHPRTVRDIKLGTLWASYHVAE